MSTNPYNGDPLQALIHEVNSSMEYREFSSLTFEASEVSSRWGIPEDTPRWSIRGYYADDGTPNDAIHANGFVGMAIAICKELHYTPSAFSLTLTRNADTGLLEVSNDTK